MNLSFFVPSLIGLLSLFSTLLNAQSSAWTAGRPDGHAPIGVMGDHYHAKGDLMFSYRVMRMDMEGMLSGDQRIDNAAVLEDYMITPETMAMDMHMLGLMYAPSNHITLMAMANLHRKNMDLLTRMGGRFGTSSSGLGDLSLAALVKLFNRNGHSLHLNLGVSLPTGDVDQRDATPMSDSAPLAYPMQLGSGTIDPWLGATYLGQTAVFSWGAQTTYRLRAGTNDRDFSYGNRLDLTTWAAVKATDFLSLSARIQYLNEGSLEGSAADWNPDLMPLFNVRNSGRSQLNLGAGLNLYVPKGPLQNLRLGIEYLLPAQQEVDGIQMEIQSSLIAGVQYAF
ncbi:MAG: transporter [Bacteroidota bacterium]